MPRQDRAILKKVSVSLPFGLGSAEWESDPTERSAAWSLYVELATRTAVEERAAWGGPAEAREALSSLYALFDITREVLKQAGPGVGASRESAGGVAIAVLNKGLRPFLDEWQPRLRAWEESRPSEVPLWQHQQQHEWPEAEKSDFWNALGALRQDLRQYTHALAVIAGVRET